MSRLIFATARLAFAVFMTASPLLATPDSPADLLPVNHIQGLFEIELPKTERRGDIRFDFQPTFRDLLDKPYLRTPIDVRWGATDRLEINGEFDTYFVDGLRHSSQGGYGFDALHLGAKYALLEWLGPAWAVSVGGNVSVPVSRPPIELTDGHNHATPYIVFGRKLGWVDGLSGFVQTSVDFVSKSSTPGNFGQNEPHSDSVTLTPGLLYHRKAFYYTLETDIATTSVIGKGRHNFLTIRPGVIWDLPKQLKLGAKGHWLAGFGVTEVFGPDGRTFSTGGRFRGEFNFRQLFGGAPSGTQ
jgi:hypothetical protein